MLPESFHIRPGTRSRWRINSRLSELEAPSISKSLLVGSVDKTSVREREAEAPAPKRQPCCPKGTPPVTLKVVAVGP